MKNIFKMIFSILFLSLVVFGASVFMLPNSELICSAATSDNTHTVNIYSSDKKTILATYQVEDGKSLNDYDNNILENGDFSVNGVPSLSSWYLGSTANTNITPVDNGVQVSYIGSGSTGYFIQDVNTSLYRGKTLCFSAYINGEYYLTYFVPTSGSSTGSPHLPTIKGINLRIYIYNNERMGITFDILSTLEETALISYAKLEVATSPTPYFTEDYITKLYRNENNLDSNDVVYWSTAQNTGMFDFNTPITEDINLYGYEDLELNENSIKLDANVNYQPSYYLLEKAIDNIEYLHIKGNLVFNVVIDTAKIDNELLVLNLCKDVLSSNQTIDIKSFSLDMYGDVLLNYGDDKTLNFIATSYNSTSSTPFFVRQDTNLGEPLFSFGIKSNVGKVLLSFSADETSSDKFNNLDFYYFYNGKDINDMNSNTNYFLNFGNLNSSYVSRFSELINIMNGVDYSINLQFDMNKFNANNYLFISYMKYDEDLGEDVGYAHAVYSLNEDTYTVSSGLYLNFYNVPYDYTMDFGFNFSLFEFVIKKPVQRVDNSLVLYNFGYNSFLNYINNITYELRKGDKYYDVQFNGQLENSKMIVIDTEFIRNNIFDEYIFLNFLNNDLSLIPIDYKDDNLGFYLGFDFNFVYYTQPLVSGNGSYDLMQYKPEYMDGTPSLVPFNIPFTAWIYNTFLFLIFDCPLISDLLGLIHLNLYFGSMINILNFYINSPIGEFVMACFTFIVFWAILKYLMPSLLGGLIKAIDKNYEDRENLRIETMKINSRYNKISKLKGRKSKVKFAYKPNSAKRYEMRNMVYKKSNKE